MTAKKQKVEPKPELTREQKLDIISQSYVTQQDIIQKAVNDVKQVTFAAVEKITVEREKLEREVFDGKTRTQVFLETGVDPVTNKSQEDIARILESMIKKLIPQEQTPCDCAICQAEKALHN